MISNINQGLLTLSINISVNFDVDSLFKNNQLKTLRNLNILNGKSFDWKNLNGMEDIEKLSLVNTKLTEIPENYRFGSNCKFKNR